MNIVTMASEIPRAINYIELRQNGDSAWQTPLNRSMYQGTIEKKSISLHNPSSPHGNKFAGCWSLIFDTADETSQRERPGAEFLIAARIEISWSSTLMLIKASNIAGGIEDGSDSEWLDIYIPKDLARDCLAL